MLTKTDPWDIRHTMSRVRFPAAALAFLCLAVILPGAARAEMSEEAIVDRECEYISGLINLGFSDFVPMVEEDLERRGISGVQERLIGLRAKSLVLQKKYDEAEDEMKKLSKNKLASWKAILDATDAYYMVGKRDLVEKNYDAFIERYPNPSTEDEKAFYKRAVYKYIQILRMMNKEVKALQVYSYLLRAEPEKQERGQILTETGQLALKLAVTSEDAGEKERLKKVAADAAEVLQWEFGDTVWFGKSVVILAQIAQMEGKRSEAIDIVMSNMKLLKLIHEQLVSLDDPDLLRLTPMAECKFLLATLHYEQGMELIEAGDERKGRAHLREAVNGFYYVFVKYPTTTWAPQAGKNMQDILDYYDSVGIPYKMPRNFNLGEVVRVMLRDGGMAMRNRDYDAAVAKYTEIITLFPELGPGSMEAMGKLAECHYEQENAIYGEAIAGHLAERYGKHRRLSEPAGDALLSLASARTRADDTNTVAWLHDLLVNEFESHPRRPMVILHRADKAREAGETDRALQLYAMLKPGDEGYDTGLSYTALIWHDRTNAVEEIRALVSLRDHSTGKGDTYGAAHAEYRIGGALLGMGRAELAVKRYKNVTKTLRDALGGRLGAEERRQHSVLLQNTILNTAAACAKVTGSEEKVAGYQQEAATILTGFVEEFEHSDQAPSALLRMGIIYMLMSKTEEADDAFNELLRRYPKSEEAKKLHYMRVKALIEMGYVSRARKSVEGMLKNDKAYSAAQFMVVARLMSTNNEHTLAMECFEIVREKTRDSEDPSDRWMIEGTLFELARLYLNMEKYADASMQVEQLFTVYSNTGYMVEGSFIKAEAFSHVAKDTSDRNKRTQLFNEAVGAVNRVLAYARGIQRDIARRADGAELDARARLMSGEVYDMKADAERAYGTDETVERAANNAAGQYYSLFQYAGIDKYPCVGPYVEEAYRRLIPHEEAGGRHGEMATLSVRYLQWFPDGKYKNEAANWLEAGFKHYKTEIPAELAREPADPESLAGIVNMCRKYIELFPEGEYRTDAEDLLPAAEEKLEKAREAEEALVEGSE